MAVYNEILAGRFNRALQKLFSIKGDPPAAQLGSEILTVLPWFLGVEFLFLETWDRYGVDMNPAGVAAQTGGIRLRNASGSNVIAVVEKIFISTTVAQTVRVSLGAKSVDLTTVATPNRLDGRQPRAAGSIIPSFTSNLTVQGPDFWGNTLAANTAADVILTRNQELTIAPGDALTVESFTANSPLEASLIWRERYLEEGERQ